MSNVIPFPTKVKVDVPIATFKDFYFQCMMNDLNAASKSLEALFNADSYDARRYATAYSNKMQTDPNLVVKTMEIREAFDSGSTNEVLALLQYCFDVSIVDAINMYGAMYANARK